MYTVKNYRTKKQLIEEFKAGVKIRVYQPGGLFPAVLNGEIALEGPHFPEPHRWYAQATIKDGVVVKVK